MTARRAVPIRGVAEVVLNARDLDAMVAFYREVLGFEAFEPDPPRVGGDSSAAPIPESVAPRSAEGGDGADARPTIVFLRIGDAGSLPGRDGAAHPPLLAIVDAARHTPASGRFETPIARHSTLNHLAFDIDEADYEREADRLAGFGLAPERRAFAWMGAKALFFRDPEGNTLELICRDSSVGGAGEGSREKTRERTRERTD